VLLRVARMEEIHPAAMEELDRVLAKQVGERGVVKPPRIGGSRKVADILNCLDTAEEGVLTRRLHELDETLGQEIQELMFVFENLKDIDGRGIQALLREVSGDTLVVALKGADDVLKNKIFSNMSKRAAEMMRDDMETKGPVKLSEVKQAQKEILQVAQRMIEAGEIMIAGKGGEEYV
jgi:flagellar motor switch protein FliG